MLKKLLEFPIFFIILLFVTFTFSQTTKAVVQIDASSSAGAFDTVNPVPSLTWSHTTGSGISRALFVGVSTTVITPTGLSTSRVLSVTYNGIALTRVGTQVSPVPASNNAVEIFRLVNPPSGTANIVVSLVASSANYVFGGAVSFTGVDQTTPNGAFFSNSNTSGMPTVTVTDGVANDIIFDTVSSSFNAQFLSAGANQTVCFPDMSVEANCRRGRRFFFFNADVGAVSTEPGSTSATMSWTLSMSPQDWAIGAIAVKAFVPSAANGEISGRVLNSRGRGISRAIISISGSDGIIKRVRTNPFGYFRITDLEVGNSYILQPKDKRYVFSPQVITLNDSVSDLYLYPVGK